MDERLAEVARKEAEQRLGQGSLGRGCSKLSLLLLCPFVNAGVCVVTSCSDVESSLLKGDDRL